MVENVAATSSVNATSRSSRSSGSGAVSVESVDIAPQRSPSTMIGAPAQERIPLSRAASATVPGMVEKSSMRAGRPASRGPRAGPSRWSPSQPSAMLLPEPAAPTHAPRAWDDLP